MTLEQRVVAELKEKNLKLATAESCTGGWIAKRITDVAGSSSVFECGVVSYSNRIKTQLLGVPSETLETHGAVSAETAREMVNGVRRLSGADIAVSVTGIAGPDADGTDKPVGLVYIAVSDGKNTVVKKQLRRFKADVRTKNRNASADCALQMVLEVLRHG